MSFNELCYKLIKTMNIDYNKVVGLPFYSAIKNSPLTEFYVNIKQSLRKLDTFYEHSLNNYTNLGQDVYNRKMTLTSTNYTIINNLSISQYYDTPRTELSYHLIEQILNKNLICDDDNIPIKLSQVVLCDFFDTSTTNFPNFHTDLEYDLFISKAFNIWYLIKNEKDYGNMFLYDIDIDIKIPYLIKHMNHTTNKAAVYKNTLWHQVTEYEEKLAEIDVHNSSFKYLNMVDGECLVMSRYLPHATDARRQPCQCRGFNFRVIVKNDDGSIDINPEYVKEFSIKPNHKLVGNKLYNVDMFDYL
jgi:hypothetical protein